MGDSLVVRGDDRKDHVEYDLLITSVFDGPVTLTSVEVVDEAGKVIGRIEGDGLNVAIQSLPAQQPVAPGA
jgi:hypothetical protein